MSNRFDTESSVASTFTNCYPLLWGNVIRVLIVCCSSCMICIHISEILITVKEFFLMNAYIREKSERKLDNEKIFKNSYMFGNSSRCRFLNCLCFSVYCTCICCMFCGYDVFLCFRFSCFCFCLRFFYRFFRLLISILKLLYIQIIKVLLIDKNIY